MKDYKQGLTLKGASVTDFKGKFGFSELILAGTDIVEQFVGGFTLDLQMDEKGENVLFILKNTTSETSASYHMTGSHDRDPNKSFDARGNLNQIFIWKEPISAVMKTGSTNQYYDVGHVVK